MTIDPALKARSSAVREVLQGVGGLASQADLARRWDITRQRVHQLTHEPDFPEPVAALSQQPVWIAAEADAWFRHREAVQARRASVRKPAPEPVSDDDW